MVVEGKVEKGIFGAGSKSERPAVFLNSGSRRFVLRRKGGNPFQDPELDTLVGKTLRCHGTVSEYIFHMERWEELSKPSR